MSLSSGRLPLGHAALRATERSRLMVDMGRRLVLLGVPAAALTLGRTAAGEDIAPTIDTRPLKLVIESGGRRYLFNQHGGTELDDYVDPFGRFAQRCIVVRRTDIPFTVFFRPDRDGTRQEVVVELGRLWSETAKTWPQYRAVVLAGDDEVASIEV